MIQKEKVKIKQGEVDVVTLTNVAGASVKLIGIGAGVMAVNVPDKEGKLGDVALGYANIADYMGDGPCSGKVPGRYANRIAFGKFKLDGVEYSLPINNGPNCNHGGPDGFHNHIWSMVDSSDDSVTFEYVSPDGEAGFPGTLTARAKYTWTGDNELKLHLTATTDKKTVVNLTNHTYWNLAGHNAGTVLNHILRLNANRYLPTDDTLIPEGVMATVAGTPMDFTFPKAIGKEIHTLFPALNYGKGYDNCWVVAAWKPGEVKPVAELYDVESGRVLVVSSDQPGVQVYTGNWLAGCPANKDGRSYEDYDGVAIECQDFPNSPNTPAFPSTELEPGKEYSRHINFKFSVK